MFGQALVFFNDLLRNLVEIIWHFIKRHNDRMYLWIIAIARVTDNAALHTHTKMCLLLSTTVYIKELTIEMNKPNKKYSILV